MIQRDTHEMFFARINIGQDCTAYLARFWLLKNAVDQTLFVCPVFRGCSITLAQLRWFSSQYLIKEGCRFLNDEGEGSGLSDRGFELVGVESGVVASDLLTIDLRLVFEVVEVISQLFAQLVHRNRSLDTRRTAVFLIQFICLLQSGAVLIPEDIVVILDEVEYHIGLQHHFGGTISVVVILSHLSIHLETVLGNSTELEVHTTHQRRVLIRRDRHT